MKEAISSFFSQVSSSKDEPQEAWENISFIVVSEFGWSQQMFFDTDIPFVLSLLRTRQKVNEEQKKALKK